MTSPAMPSFDRPSLDQLASAIEAQAPELASTVRPLSVLGEGYASLAVETAGGVVVRIPKRPESAIAAAVEARLLAAVAPSLPVEAPLPRWHGSPTHAAPYGFSAYAKVPGHTLDLRALSAAASGHLADQIAGFLAALHAFPVARARALGGVDDWRGHYARFHDTVMPGLRRHLDSREYRAVDAWWSGFLANPANWAFTPAIVHGDIEPEHLLVDDLGTLTGVIDFGEVCIGDPAVDLGGLIAYVDLYFARAVHTAYSRRQEAPDGDLLRRAGALAEAASFFWVNAALHLGDPSLPTIEQALAGLRAGAILSRG